MNADRWGFFNPVRIRFANGAINNLGQLVESRRAVLVTSAGFIQRGVAARINRLLPSGLAGTIGDVMPNPDITHMEAQRARLKSFRPDLIIALGGGSALDSAKTLSRVTGIDDDVSIKTHLTSSANVATSSLPVIAIPTTTGTGAEVTPFATIWDFHNGKKHSLAGDDLYPSSAILDPELTDGLPWSIAAASGLDALSHSLESTWNRSASPISLVLSRQAARLSIIGLKSICTGGTDRAIRSSMMQASLFAGLSISQTRTALAHSISYPLTSLLHWPHGVACSFTLPAILEFNAVVDDGRLQHLANELGHDSAKELALELRSLLRRIGIGKLIRGLTSDKAAVLSLTDQMFTPERSLNNLRDASRTDVIEIVGESLDEIN